MKKKYKKIIIILTFILLSFSLVYCIFIAQKYNKLMLYYQHIATTLSDKIIVDNKEAGEVWSTYHDERYGFTVDYPANLYVTSVYNHKEQISNTEYRTINGGVFFSVDENGGGGAAIAVYENSQFSSLDEWLKAENKRLVSSHYQIDAYPDVDKYSAISAYLAGDTFEGHPGEDFKDQRLLAFFKGKQLFVISTGGEIIYSKILSSFKFDK